MLTELEPVPAAALPLAALRDHLRLGTGFADDAVQDAILEAALRAALAAIEARTARALVARAMSLRVTRWRDEAALVLPVGPVAALTGFEILDARGAARDALGRVALSHPAGGRQVVEGRGGALPAIPEGGSAVVGFIAGHGPWEAVPADLRHAVTMLAASYYEDRGAAREVAFPPVVAALIAPWRVLRLGGAR